MKRIALVVKRKEERSKVRKLEHEKVYLERVEARNQIQLKRVVEREKEKDTRKVLIEERKNIQKKRHLENEKGKIKDSTYCLVAQHGFQSTYIFPSSDSLHETYGNIYFPRSSMPCSSSLLFFFQCCVCCI